MPTSEAGSSPGSGVLCAAPPRQRQAWGHRPSRRAAPRLSQPPRGAAPPRQRQAWGLYTPSRGFTLLEMLVALIIVGMVTALAAFALPPSQNAQMQREAQRLSALFDAARQHAAETGVPLAWASGPTGYAFVQIGPQGWEPVDSDLLRPRLWPWLDGEHDIPPQDWRSALGGQPREAAYSAGTVTVHLREGGVRSLGTPPSWLLFGSEPVGGAIEIVLSDGAERDRIQSDGFAPFVVSRSRS